MSETEAIQMDYLQRAVERYGEHRRRLFAYSWLTGLTHDFLNQIGAMDQDLADFFGSLSPPYSFSKAHIIFYCLQMESNATWIKVS